MIRCLLLSVLVDGVVCSFAQSFACANPKPRPQPYTKNHSNAFKNNIYPIPTQHLRETTKKQTEGRAKLGVEAFAEALLVVPKILAENAGYDPQDVLITLQEEHDAGSVVGLDLNTGTPADPSLAGVYDNYAVKKQMVQSAPIVASQLLLVDEVIRAGVNMRNK